MVDVLKLLKHGQVRDIAKYLDIPLGSTKTDAVYNVNQLRDFLVKKTTVKIVVTIAD